MSEPCAHSHAVVEVAILQKIAQGLALPQVLDALVRAIEADAPGVIASVLLLDAEGRLHTGAAPHLPRAFLDVIEGQPIGPCAGSCGTSAWRREAVVVEDISTDPLWKDFRDGALVEGLRACWSVPILGEQGDVLGTFAMYHRAPERPSADLMQIAQSAAHLAAIAIERERRERDLIDGEARVRAILDHALDANVLMDSDGVVTGWAAPAVALFGWSASEALGRRLSELIIPAAQRAEHERGLQHFLRTGQGPLLGRRIEVTALHRDGRELPVELAVTPLTWQGAVTFSAFVRDLTEKRELDAALQGSREHLALVYQNAADVLFHLDVTGQGEYRFASANPAFFRVTGLTPEQVLGRSVAEVIPEPSLSLVLGKYAQALATRQTVRWDETTKYPSGTRCADVSITPVFDTQGRPRYLIGAVRDVTERRELEEEVQQLQKMEAIGRLSGGIAHDFNNILGVILGYGSMLLDEITDAAQREEIAEVVRAAQRGADLTRQFLAFSRKQVLQPAVLDAGTVVTQLEKFLRRLIPEHIGLQTRLAPDLWRIEADQGRLEQVLINLVVNARDAMPHGGTITLETANVTLDERACAGQPERAPGDYVRITVRDTGTGMDEATRRRIFEPFFTTKPAGQGTGLGLALVYGIVKQSGGHVRVASALGEGSTFDLYLPRTQAQPQDTPMRSYPSMRRKYGHVLIVEDEPALRRLFEKTLRKLECHVTVADGPLAALACTEEQPTPPDLLITDVVLPGMSGRALGERLRQRNPDLLILYVSGYPEDATLPDGPLAPGTPFLQKPFSAGDLVAALQGLTGAWP